MRAAQLLVFPGRMAGQECCRLVVVSALQGDHFARVTAETVQTQTLPAPFTLTKTSDKHTLSRVPKFNTGEPRDRQRSQGCCFFVLLSFFWAVVVENVFYPLN